MPADKCGYIPLQDPEREIGLFELLRRLPRWQHPRIGLFHWRFPTGQTKETRAGLAKVQSTPMLGWTALLDLEGRRIFKATDGRRVPYEALYYSWGEMRKSPSRLVLVGKDAQRRRSGCRGLAISTLKYIGKQFEFVPRLWAAHRAPRFVGGNCLSTPERVVSASPQMGDGRRFPYSWTARSLRHCGHPESTYRVVNECFIYGLRGGAGLLGRLPHPWRISLTADIGSRRKATFWKKYSLQRTSVGPRLVTMADWQPVGRSVGGDDPEVANPIRQTSLMC
ncbi:hypothetical protein MAPG_11146 [Magnaporthiopsis poae ATCC 64411]|uniref:Uncharacterized protein n=1 Tax=Magnaporthiopsis poae (strain ATCC 64411 / 73-15) TaxID=644358 RepID=A0A0C4EEH3_MAGP6|nr:hypothetical protein MAPG_11146 [Magnaporthiopsis poae ATCC 64411]